MAVLSETEDQDTRSPQSSHSDYGLKAEVVWLVGFVHSLLS
jgi:hypothetical protein